MKFTPKVIIQYLVALSVAIGLLYLAFRNVDFEAFWEKNYHFCVIFANLDLQDMFSNWKLKKKGIQIFSGGQNLKKMVKF